LWVLEKYETTIRLLDKCLKAYFNVIGQKVLSEEALESLEKRHYETLCFLEMYFSPTFFDISVHFMTHFIKEINLLGHVFLH
jgi:hypothetical protein